MVNQETKIFLSASARPGSFGCTVYNHLFKEYSVNAIYLPREIHSAESLIRAIKIFNIAGCSISMPLKKTVIEYLDRVDQVSTKTSSVNTILNKDGTLEGYNTDFFGLKKIFTRINAKNVLIYGAGALARTAIFALKAVSCPGICVAARRPEEARAIAEHYKIKFVTEKDAIKYNYVLFVNTTPAGLDSVSKIILSLISASESVFDAVVSSTPTILIKEALLKGKNIIDGIELCKYQLQEQFKIYTGVLPDMKLINNIIKDHYLKK